MDDSAAQFKAYQNFNDASVEDVQIGPRQEVLLRVSPVLWRGSTRKHEGTVTIRFGQIKDFTAVAEKFREIPALGSEIGFLGPDPESADWKGGIHRLKFGSERRNYEFTFCCGNVTIEGEETTQP